MSVLTCYIFTEVEPDLSVIETILKRYAEKYDAFILDSPELNGCLLPLMNGASVDQARVSDINVYKVLTNPPDVFIVDSPIFAKKLERKGSLEQTHKRYFDQKSYPETYISQLNKTNVEYAKKEGMITSVILFTGEHLKPKRIRLSNRKG